MTRQTRISPAVLFSASPFLDGFITVAAGFIIAALLTTGGIVAAEASLFS